MFAEMGPFYGQVVNFVAGSYEAAEAQAKEAAGTPLEIPARNSAVYYAVALTLLADGEAYYVTGFDSQPALRKGIASRRRCSPRLTRPSWKWRSRSSR